MLNKRQVILESERLLFSKFHLDDAQAFFELNADDLVLQYTGDDPFPSVEDCKKFISEYDHYDRNGFGRWSVITKIDNQIIGWCGLRHHDDGDYVDLGFRFLRNEWNKGYATEAARACAKFAFEELDIGELVGRVARKNIASIKVLEKIGMKYWKEDTCQGIEDSLYFVLKESTLV